MKKEVFSRLPKSAVLAADVGGTNTTIGLCSVGKKVQIHAKYVFETQKIRVEDAVRKVLKDSNVKISSACIAAAGPVSPDKKTVQLTNVKWKIDIRKLPFKAKLLNDFEAMGYSINVLQSRDAKVVRKGKPNKLPIALIGAGTGLGKALLYHNGKIYVPKPSEGGHVDLPAMLDEFPLLSWLFRNKIQVMYEDVLSGRGIVSIYKFMCTRYSGSGVSDPGKIMQEDSPAAEATRSQFVKFYARCAKNFALDGLTRGGVFIGGGNAAKNPYLFDSRFIKEFMRNESQKRVLEQIPIKVITNYDVGLIGAAFAARV